MNRGVKAQKIGLRRQMPGGWARVEEHLSFNARKGSKPDVFVSLDHDRDLATFGIQLRDFPIVGISLMFE
ncbi:hypothetical protein BFX06_00630 [Sulfobacillus thermosulfidooxidans]|nr:hypothetical protein BFX05_07035 [Sulfobacillus thermosulfidooxidans]OLZ18701.1 hypothetical protein BFX06_00630 [Sulfobacillus thermosulfidooxidans]OLZ20220.1 hypothetical protein BFX07_01170 [Sulfobacillus thermosulfidooxidans]